MGPPFIPPFSPTLVQAKNADLLDKNLGYEREIQQFGSVKRQLESYKQGATDSELSLRELKSSLKEKEGLVTTLKQDLGMARDSASQLQKRVQELEDEIEHSVRGGVVDLHGIGGGLSEYNPGKLTAIT